MAPAQVADKPTPQRRPSAVCLTDAGRFVRCVRCSRRPVAVIGLLDAIYLGGAVEGPLNHAIRTRVLAAGVCLLAVRSSSCQCARNRSGLGSTSMNVLKPTGLRTAGRSDRSIRSSCSAVKQTAGSRSRWRNFLTNRAVPPAQELARPKWLSNRSSFASPMAAACGPGVCLSGTTSSMAQGVDPVSPTVGPLG
jgi:hypothetical protein